MELCSGNYRYTSTHTRVVESERDRGGGPPHRPATREMTLDNPALSRFIHSIAIHSPHLFSAEREAHPVVTFPTVCRNSYTDSSYIL